MGLSIAVIAFFRQNSRRENENTYKEMHAADFKRTIIINAQSSMKKAEYLDALDKNCECNQVMNMWCCFVMVFYSDVKYSGLKKLEGEAVARCKYSGR